MVFDGLVSSSHEVQSILISFDQCAKLTRSMVLGLAIEASPVNIVRVKVFDIIRCSRKVVCQIPPIPYVFGLDFVRTIQHHAHR